MSAIAHLTAALLATAPEDAADRHAVLRNLDQLLRLGATRAGCCTRLQSGAPPLDHTPVTAMITPRVVSLNIGGIRKVEWHGRVVSTGIWKQPTSVRVALRGVNFVGDDQADRSVHGGVDKAVYAYASEDYAYWKAKENMTIEPGLFGENLTVEGLDLPNSCYGEQWSIGSALLEVAQPRLPCFKLGIRVGDDTFLKRFMLALRPGAYLRILQEGDIGAGDEVRVVYKPEHRVTLRSMIEALGDRHKAVALQPLKGLPEMWQNVADSADD